MVKMGCLRELRTVLDRSMCWCWCCCPYVDRAVYIMLCYLSNRDLHEDRMLKQQQILVKYYTIDSSLEYSKNLLTACKAFFFVCSYKAFYQQSLLQSQIPFNKSESRYLRVLMYRLCDSWIAEQYSRAGLPMYHHPKEPLVMSIQSTCLVWYYYVTHM